MISLHKIVCACSGYQELPERSATLRLVAIFAPVPLPAFAVKQHWHERYRADPGNAWLRAELKGLMAAWSPDK